MTDNFEEGSCEKGPILLESEVKATWEYWEERNHQG